MDVGMIVKLYSCLIDVVVRRYLLLVSTGFWGGLVPENAENASSLERLLNAGVLGLKVIWLTYMRLSLISRLSESQAKIDDISNILNTKCFWTSSLTSQILPYELTMYLLCLRDHLGHSL